MVFVTLALDAMPFVTLHWPEFSKLKFDWEWHVAEGVAAPAADTSWCSTQTPRLSEDGTTGYLEAIAAYDKRVRLYRKELWHGKVTMLNTMLKRMAEPCLLVQVDSDELHTAEQLTALRSLFITQPKKNAAYFWCDYRLGPGIHIPSRDTYGNYSSYEWLRAWRWEPWMSFKTHEPPVMASADGTPMPLNAFTHAETEKAGLVFRHEAYSTEAQVRFKQSYYGSANNKKGALYKDAVDGWRRLQLNRKWPVKELKAFLPWVGDGVVADKIK